MITSTSERSSKISSPIVPTPAISAEVEGVAEWREALPRHYAENVGTTPVRIVLVEVKPPRGGDRRAR